MVLTKNADNVTITPLLEADSGFMAEDIVFNSDANLGILKFRKSYKYANDMGADICNISAVVVDSENAIREAIHNSDMYFVVAAGIFSLFQL